MEFAYVQRPAEAAVAAWTCLIRAERGVRTAIEADLKKAGYPPLAWYDVLLELKRSKRGYLTPRELEHAMLFEQYNLSRLLDRMEGEHLLRRAPYPGDRRRQLIEITDAGRALQRRMWPVYGSAIDRFVGSKLAKGEADQLASLLQKLMD